MVFESIVERAVDAHGACDGVVGHGALNTSARSFVYFIDSTHVNCLAIIWLDFLHQIAIAIPSPTLRAGSDELRVSPTPSGDSPSGLSIGSPPNPQGKV